MRQYNQEPAASPPSTRRFSDRVADYVRFRPGYPLQLVETLEDVTGLPSGSRVADIGSGTGISARPFLRRGYQVFAVEPNDAMRAAAEHDLAAEPAFVSVPGTAEETGLPDGSVDLVVAGQAFHWFRPEHARIEFARILRPPGWTALFWNHRRTDTPFLAAYERLLLEHATDYAQVDHRNLGPERLREFFAAEYLTRTLPNHQQFDFPALRGRLLSSSYAPKEAEPGHAAMIESLHQIFGEHQVNGVVRFEYDTEIHIARLVG